MPHLVDLTPGTIFQGNNGDRWQVGDGIQSEEEMTVVLKKLKVVSEIQELIPE